jgi:hypothetical protein
VHGGHEAPRALRQTNPRDCRQARSPARSGRSPRERRAAHGGRGGIAGSPSAGSALANRGDGQSGARTEGGSHRRVRLGARGFGRVHVRGTARSHRRGGPDADSDGARTLARCHVRDGRGDGSRYGDLPHRRRCVRGAGPPAAPAAHLGGARSEGGGRDRGGAPQSEVLVRTAHVEARPRGARHDPHRADSRSRPGR